MILVSNNLKVINDNIWLSVKVSSNEMHDKNSVLITKSWLSTNY